MILLFKYVLAFLAYLFLWFHAIIFPFYTIIEVLLADWVYYYFPADWVDVIACSRPGEWLPESSPLR